MQDLDLLRVFDVVVEERHLTRAAARLKVTQSAVSHRLRRLRELLDDPILVSGSDGLVPTALAQSLSVPVRTALDDLQQAFAELEPFDPATATRRFVFAAGDIAESLALPGIMSELQRQAPHVSVQTRPFGPDLWRKLERGDIDIAGHVNPDAPAGIRRTAFQREGFVVLAREDHPIIGRQLSLPEFLRCSHLLIAPQGAQRGLVDGLLAKQGLERQIGARIAHFSTAPFIVAGSELVLTAPWSVGELGARHLPVRRYTPPLETPTLTTYLFWHERWENDPGHRWFRQLFIPAARRYARRVEASERRRRRSGGPWLNPG